MTDYEQFISGKSQLESSGGFEPHWIPDFLFDFQKHLVEWSIRHGRSALFEDCGLGKTPQQLVWAQNVVIETSKPVLVLTPLAVSGQTEREARKFGIDAEVSRDGKIPAKITITNYERLHYFDREKFGGVVCDESSILKNFDGATKEAVTEFMRVIQHRLLCTATAAPNDYIELGTSSEALGHLGYMDMLQRFFKSNKNTCANGGGNGLKRFNKQPFGGEYRFRGHAERDFWRWVCSWARAVRKPSDIGFSDDAFKLPELQMVEHVVKASTRNPGMLFDLPAVGLKEQRDERRRTLDERCEMAAALVNNTGNPFVSWCYLNAEGDLLEKLIPDAVQISGDDPDDKKEEAFDGFLLGEIRGLISKPMIAGLGLNWQHCAHQTFFPSHSFEQWYQSIRRCWRFGQKNPVRVDMISSEGEAGVLKNLNRKSEAAEEMFQNLVALVNQGQKFNSINRHTNITELPIWL